MPGWSSWLIKLSLHFRQLLWDGFSDVEISAVLHIFKGVSRKVVPAKPLAKSLPLVAVNLVRSLALQLTDSHLLPIMTLPACLPKCSDLAHGWFPFSLFPRARGGGAGGVPVSGENTHWACGRGSCLAASPCQALGPSEYFPQAPGNWNTVSAMQLRGLPSCRQPLLQSLQRSGITPLRGGGPGLGVRPFIFNSWHHYFKTLHLFWFLK